MATVGARLRSIAVTAFVVLVTASALTSAAHAAAPAPSPTPQPTTNANALPLTLDPTSARPGDSVAVTFQGWKSETCSLFYDQDIEPTGSCTATNGVLTGSLLVPNDATPNTAVPVIACPTDCGHDNFTASEPLNILPPLATSRPTGGTVPVKPPPHKRHHAAPPPPTTTNGHTTAYVEAGAVVVFIASVLGLLLLRPPMTGEPPVIRLVPRPDPGVVTVDPATAAKDINARVTIRLRPDAGRTRVEARLR